MSRSYQDLAWSCMILQNNLIRSLPRSCQDHYKILSRSYQDLKNIFPRSLKDLVKILPGSCSFLQDLVQDLAWSYQRSCQDYNKDLAKISPRSCQDLTKVFNLGIYMLMDVEKILQGKKRMNSELWSEVLQAEPSLPC